MLIAMGGRLWHIKTHTRNPTSTMPWRSAIANVQQTNPMSTKVPSDASCRSRACGNLVPLSSAMNVCCFESIFLNLVLFGLLGVGIENDSRSHS